MTRLVVRLLGGCRVELDGEAVYGFETDKARALLAYLMVEADRPHRRETLAEPALARPARRRGARPIFARRSHPAAGTVGSCVPPRGQRSFLFVTPTDMQFNMASDYTPGRCGAAGVLPDCPARQLATPARGAVRRFPRGFRGAGQRSISGVGAEQAGALSPAGPGDPGRQNASFEAAGDLRARRWPRPGVS